MTIGSLLDQVAGNADDNSASYRAAARRWLNLTRSHIASRATWRSALAQDTFETIAATSLYPLVGVTGIQYEAVHGDRLFDQTSSLALQFVGLQQIDEQDPERTVTGAPTVWADAGMDTSGRRQVFLWPTPDSILTVQFWGFRILEDLNETQEGLAVDPYFGPVAPWAAAFAAGLNYFQYLDNNEDGISIQSALRNFERLIRTRKSTNTIAPVAGLMPMNVRGTGTSMMRGRLDPAHYNNG